MTPEEAAEVILEGNAWERCLHCQGKGEIETREGNFGDSVQQDTCTQCMGQGYQHTDAFVEACAVLEREYPKKPMSRKEMSEWFMSAVNKMPLGEMLRETMNRPSLARRIFPPHPIMLKPDDKP